MRILMVTTETSPFAKTGGLADMVSALSSSLINRDVDVRIVMPRYYCVNRDNLEKYPPPLYVPTPYSEEWAAVYRGELPSSGVPVYFIDHEELYGRAGIYGYTPEEGFPDNARRYAFFCRSVFHLCRMIDWIPDVFHCHDWGASLVPYLLRREEHTGEFSGSFSMLTIHNLGYQGIFPLSDSSFVKRYRSNWELSEIEFDGALNFLKTGIMTADSLTTVSPTYAEEIKRPGYGHRLEGILGLRKNDLHGILNGADYEHWNPETDSYIAPNNYSPAKPANKKKVKKSLQREFGLPEDISKPIIGMVTRLVSQKGINELIFPGSGSLYHICMDFDIQFVIVGSGDKWCEIELGRLASRLENLKVWIGYSERLAHLVEAGSDFFLMPSRYEPCGLNQLYSLKYGTLPIVRNTGGLADAVENYNGETGEGTGFVFNDLNPSSLYNTIGWAVSTWYNKKTDIEKMKKRAMKKDFSWDNSADKYKSLYSELLKMRNNLI
ncbi:MAG: glycogen synthase [Spirochaetia bacterium]|nr:glycogen synthase [Spirochaetia bacterium]